MHRSPLPRRPSLALAALALLGSLLQAQTPGRQPSGPRPLDPAVEFLSPYGLSNFPQHYVDALSALLRAQELYDDRSYAAAQDVLDELWAAHPTGGTDWGQLPTRPFGLFLGTPPCYYALRMLSDTVDWRVASPGGGRPLRTARLTVILVGHSNGIEPRTVEELVAGTGVPVQHDLDPRLLRNGSRIVHRSLALFREYVVAMTGGALEVETHVLHLPDLDLPVKAQVVSGRYYAGLVDAGQVWPFVPAADLSATDWWWILYPSHVPEQYPDFAGAEFVTGGMGTGPDSASPYFIVDDRWLVRKPPHLGDGDYTKTERETYLPQWLQHEFFHHLFRTYPQFGLESTPHQWFNRSTWPPDFVGRYEADYFHEALVKRLQGASPPLVAALRYATDGVDWSALSVADVLGLYQRSPLLNPWHLGVIQLGPQLEWENQAPVSWSLTDDLANGNLLTGPDCPYYGSWNGNKFDLVPRRNALGDPLQEIAGFAFNGELYERIGP